MKLSVVSPIYKAGECLPELYRRLTKELGGLAGKGIDDYEMIFVDDASPTDDWPRIVELSKQDSHVIGIQLSRNFGQHRAILAGLRQTSGDWVVVMDCDLQDRPEEIPALFAQATANNDDLVLARRSVRQDNLLKRSLSSSFYRVLSYLTGTRFDPTIANFGIYRKAVIDEIRSMPESHIYFPVMIQWLGFQSSTYDVAHGQRFSGVTSYTLRKTVNLALETTLSFSDKPLRLVVVLGLGISVLAVSYALYAFVRALGGGYSVLGWPTLVISIWFLSGLIIFVLGVVGLYVGRTFEQVKSRPQYVIRKTAPQTSQSK